MLHDPQDSKAPVIVTISGRRRSLVPAEDGVSNNDPTELLPAYQDGLRHCGLVAQSPTLSPDFIVLTLSHHIFHEEFQGPLASAMRILLGQGYSVTIKTLSVRDSDPYEDQPMLLLAAPCVSNPQWIDDTISDLRIMSSGANGPNGSIETPAIGAETSRSGHSDVKDLELDQPTQGSGVPAPVDANLPATFAWSEATDVVERNELSPCRPKLINDLFHQNVAHQVANIVSRVIGEFSKRKQHGPCSPVLAFDDQKEAKKQRL